MRRKLYSFAMLVLSDMIMYNARWANVEALWMNPYHTSELCAICRCVLEGRDYHFRYCRRCNVRVDRDVNASDNVRLTTAAARYGPEVRALPDEAGRFADLTVCPADLMTDGMTILVDGKVVWSRGAS
ncbi:MAG: transposase [Nitrosopumilaceae archaeon]|nr:transposase [Nitrosopumilaceae archaeon]